MAYSVLETLRFAAARVLDMHLDDLQILVIVHVDRDVVDALMWEPMPGGAGLLDQICQRFEEIAAVAREVVEHCPAACEKSCIDCLQTFRNGYYHKYLDRKAAQEHLAALADHLKTEEGLVYRYIHDDGFGKPETTFLVCAFWYAEAMASSGKVDIAARTIEKLLEYSNHLGLFSEDAGLDGSQWGNFPQTYSHVGLMNAIYRIAAKLDRPVFL